MSAEHGDHSSYSHNSHSQSRSHSRHSPDMSSSDLRKINKPLVEKKRRERINTCLEQLKSLILDASKRESCRYSKLEKADILEMTVAHLRNSQRHRVSAVLSNDMVNRYRAGFNECANEVTRCLGRVEGLTPDAKSRVMNHMASCLHTVNSAPTSPAFAAGSASPQLHPSPATPASTPLHALPGHGRPVYPSPVPFTPLNLNLRGHTGLLTTVPSPMTPEHVKARTATAHAHSSATSSEQLDNRHMRTPSPSVSGLSYIRSLRMRYDSVSPQMPLGDVSRARFLNASLETDNSDSENENDDSALDNNNMVDYNSNYINMPSRMPQPSRGEENSRSNSRASHASNHSNREAAAVPDNRPQPEEDEDMWRPW